MDTSIGLPCSPDLNGLPAELRVHHGPISGWLPVTLVAPRFDYGRKRWRIQTADGDIHSVDAERLRVPQFQVTRRAADPALYGCAGSEAVGG